MLPANHPWATLRVDYHGDRDRLLLQCLEPACRALARDGAADQLVFDRGLLGGPHVRLQVRHRPSARELISDRISAAAAAFFRSWPAPSRVSAERIREHAARAGAADVEPRADASCQLLPAGAPVELVGEADRQFAAACGLRVLAALPWLTYRPHHHRTTQGFRLLVAQVLGWISSADDVAPLLDDGDPVARDRARAAFEPSRDAYAELWIDAVERARQPGMEGAVAGLAHRFRHEVEEAGERADLARGAAAAIRTLDQLGLERDEIARLRWLAWHSARSIRDHQPQRWSELAGQLDGRETPATPLAETATRELAAEVRGPCLLPEISHAER